MNVIKNDRLLKEGSLSLSKQLSAENLYRNVSYLLLVALIIVAFFISLADNSFDITKIAEAQFWIDFSITTGGGLILKWAFGKYGIFQGHKHKEVNKALISVNNLNDEIKRQGLLDNLRDLISHTNKIKKLKAIKRLVWLKSYRHPKSKKWQKLKECVKLTEELLEQNVTPEREKEIEEKLFQYNFDLDSYKIKYKPISEASLKTGMPTQEKDDENFTFNELWELFGKSSLVTAFTISLSVLFAISDPEMTNVTLTTLFIFFSRVTTFILNSYSGFIIGKTSVETKKLQILNSIDRFLSRFIELSKKEVTVNE